MLIRMKCFLIRIEHYIMWYNDVNQRFSYEWTVKITQIEPTLKIQFGALQSPKETFKHINLIKSINLLLYSFNVLLWVLSFQLIWQLIGTVERFRRTSMISSAAVLQQSNEEQDGVEDAVIFLLLFHCYYNNNSALAKTSKRLFYKQSSQTIITSERFTTRRGW